MNISFFLLLLTLFALAFLTSWNKHVLMLLGVTTCLWVAMMWFAILFLAWWWKAEVSDRFVLEITKVQNRPDNMPLMEVMGASDLDKPPLEEAKKDR